MSRCLLQGFLHYVFCNLSSCTALSWLGPPSLPFYVHPLASGSSALALSGCVGSTLICATSIPHLDAAPVPHLASFLLASLQTAARIHVVMARVIQRDRGVRSDPQALRGLVLLASCASALSLRCRPSSSPVPTAPSLFRRFHLGVLALALQTQRLGASLSSPGGCQRGVLSRLPLETVPIPSPYCSFRAPSKHLCSGPSVAECESCG